MKDFFERLNALGQPKRSDIIEKDFHLHRLLSLISKNDYLHKNLIFKGGTCLIKGYLGYYRFSEDLDFTWCDDSLWRGKSKTELKRSCSKKITELLEQFHKISNEMGFDFCGDKNNTNEVHISSGGRMVLFFFGYQSEIMNLPSKIKIEINFVENVIYPSKIMTLKSYVDKIASEEIEFLFEPLWKEYNKNIRLSSYDPREIFLEKCRAALTRKVFKLRDLIDIFYMNKVLKYKISDYNLEIRDKIGFMLDLYERYRQNIEIPPGLPKEILNDDELKLLLDPPPKEMNNKFGEIINELENIRIYFFEK
jgi:predicted nucleotidyltransferase component of viral defense system